MSFQFGLSSADLSDDELSDTQNGFQNFSNETPSESGQAANPLDAPYLRSGELKQPKYEDLSTILKSLQDVRVSFEKFYTPEEKIGLYRRELFDVKHQLMTESDDNANVQINAELEILIGDTNEDVRKNVYEGGLKSWECSIDLVNALSKSVNAMFSSGTILELGCGTSLPSEYLFIQLLQNAQGPCNAKFILADYNESVLRLVSIPNMIIAWAFESLSSQDRCALQQCGDETIPVVENELLLTSALLDSFLNDITKRGINLTLMSGTWGRDFYNMLSSEICRTNDLLVLSSETIYQPDMLPVISELLLEILRPDLEPLNSSVKALVAAKDIYFGVGGSVIEFQNYMQKRINAKKLDLTLQTFKVQAGLKRSIVSLE